MVTNLFIVAYDGSSGSKKALDWALRNAGKLDAAVTAVTVVKPPEFSPSVSEIEEYFEDAQNHYRPMLKQVKELGDRAGVEVSTEILRGHPAESIVRYATDHAADMIIMGTRGMGGFKNLVIGSVAQKVVSYAKVPVLIMKN